ncbi:hypothetical protein [Gracilimonas sp.]|uniref:hypothetical protein n=1 Tax=Gracilimonas sp. TaxID=1974203 RepID=UPI0032EC8B38
MKHSTFLLIILFLNGCIIGSEYERTNSLDPDSPKFKADFSDPEAILKLDDRAFQIQWISRSSFDDGHLIEKKLNNKFFTLDTLLSESFYMDSSGEYTTDMEYKISSFRFDEKGNIKNKFSKKIKKINFGNVRSLTAFRNNDSLSIQWFRNSFLDDLTILEFRSDNDENWNELYSENQQRDTFRRITFDLPLDQSYEFRIRLFMDNYKHEQEEFYSDTIYYDNM